MDFVRYMIPRHFFPRFEYASERSLELQSRYYRLIGIPTEKTLQKIQNVTVYLCKKRNEAEFPVDIEDVIVGQNLDPGLKIKSQNINLFLNSHEDNKSDASLLFIDSKYKRSIVKLRPTKVHIILVAKDEDAAKEINIDNKGQNKLNLTVTKKEETSNKINNVLEQIALAPLKKMCENCNDMLKKIEEKKNSKVVNRNGTKQTNKNSSHHYGSPQTSPSDPHLQDQKYNHMDNTAVLKLAQASCGERNGYTVPQRQEKTAFKTTKRASIDEASSIKPKVDLSTKKHIRTRSEIKHETMINGFKDNAKALKDLGSTTTKKLARQRSSEFDSEIEYKGKRRKSELSDQIDGLHTERQSSAKCQEEENPERLLEAILALYGMSNVPETERPDVPKHSCKVNKEMRNELFKISPTIKRMGYRYRTFYIYAVKPKSATDERIRNNKIFSVLKKYGIKAYEVAPCDDQITELEHVGAKIQARSQTTISLRSRKVCRPEVVKGGTLGCFARMSGAEAQCGLLSKHVTEGCNEIYHVGNDNKKIGRMLDETNKHRYGGLDISAASMDEYITGSGTYFKDTRENLLKGTLHDYKEEELDEDKICRRGQSVHIYGATSNPGKGEITMSSVDVGLSSTLIQIEDQVGGDGKVKSHFAEKGDSGAIVCVEDPDRKTIHALSMVMGTPDSESTSSYKQTYLTLPLSKGFKQLEADTGKRFELC